MLAVLDGATLTIIQRSLVDAAPASHVGDNTRHITAAERAAWNGKAAGDHTHTAAQVGAAPVSHSHTAAQVGAAASNHTHTAAQVGAAAASHNHDTGNITSGVLPVARGGTGTTNLTNVTVGNVSGRSQAKVGALEINTIYPDANHANAMQKIQDYIVLGFGNELGGKPNESVGYWSEFVVGCNNTIYGDYGTAVCARDCTVSSGFATGVGLICKGEVVIGDYNVASAPTVGNQFVIGGGLGENSRSNAFRVTYQGQVFGCYGYESSGADYAEHFEWCDQNPNNEDRRGLFVTLENDKIRLAKSDDAYVLGVVSDTYSACIIGDSYFGDNWHKMYLTDLYGRPLTERKNIKFSKDTGLELTEREIADGAEYEEKQVEVRVKNPEYNPDEKYIPRSERPEWGLVGLLGKLTVVDDGTCLPNGYCTVGDNGKATAAATGYRVMKRLDETHIRVLIK